MRIFSLFLSALLAIGGCGYADASIDEIVRKIDELFRSEYSTATVSMTITTPNWERTLDLDLWSRGMDDTFIVITSPKKDKGITTLRKNSEMWNYFPKIDKIIKVPPSMMIGSWMGSDFTNDDLVKESSLLKDYISAFTVGEEPPQGHVLISLTPKAHTISLWSEIRLLVRLDDAMPIEETFYDEHGAKIRMLTLRDVKEMGGKRIPTVLTMTPLTKEGHRTVVRYHTARFNEKIADEIFSLKNLRAKR